MPKANDSKTQLVASDAKDFGSNNPPKTTTVAAGNFNERVRRMSYVSSSKEMIRPTRSIKVRKRKKRRPRKCLKQMTARRNSSLVTQRILVQITPQRQQQRFSVLRGAV